jgi:hypothetical protein
VKSSSTNEELQSEVKEARQIIIKEKNQRKQIKSLQSQINSLRNQPRNSVNQDKINDLEIQIKELKSSNSPRPGDKHEKQQPSKDKDNHSFLKPFCLGIVVCLFVVIVVFALKKLFD